jgi:hypothetical protein
MITIVMIMTIINGDYFENPKGILWESYRNPLGILMESCWES